MCNIVELRSPAIKYYQAHLVRAAARTLRELEKALRTAEAIPTEIEGVDKSSCIASIERAIRLMQGTIKRNEEV